MRRASPVPLAMRTPRVPVLMALTLLLLLADCAVEQDTKNHKSLFGTILEAVQHAQDTGTQTRTRTGTAVYAQWTGEKERKDSHKLKTKNGEKILEIFPRDLRKKKVLELLTGPLYFSPKCRKHVYRLYHDTRDCKIPAYYKRCARLLTRLARSRRCLGS